MTIVDSLPDRPITFEEARELCRLDSVLSTQLVGDAGEPAHAWLCVVRTDWSVEGYIFMSEDREWGSIDDLDTSELSSSQREFADYVAVQRGVFR